MSRSNHLHKRLILSQWLLLIAGIITFICGCLWAINAFYLHVIMGGHLDYFSDNIIFKNLPIFEELWRLPMNNLINASTHMSKSLGVDHKSMLNVFNLFIIISAFILSFIFILMGLNRKKKLSLFKISTN